MTLYFPKNEYADLDASSGKAVLHCVSSEVALEVVLKVSTAHEPRVIVDPDKIPAILLLRVLPYDMPGYQSYVLLAPSANLSGLLVFVGRSRESVQ